MRSPRLILALGLLFASTLRAAEPFAQQGSDLKADPAARFGTLPNGLRYVVMPNVEPKGRASLRLVVAAGSLHENENQRGIAHFLEHMAFNGSRNFAPGTLIEVFQRMGMDFGSDTNARTSFDRTIYLIELPDTREATVAEGMRVLGDYAGSLLLLDSEIDRERGVILSEKRARDSVSYRTFVSEFNFVLGSSLLPKRLPIGEEGVISGAKREVFADFYDAWYRPERLSVVAVGDFDAAQMERQIAGTFSGLTGRGQPRAVPSYGQVDQPSGLRVNFHREVEAPATTISLSAITPYSYEPDNAANRLKYLPRELAFAILNRRLSILAKQENATFTNGSANAGENFDFYRDVSIELVTRPAQWSAALATAEQEVRRAAEHGFQPAELREVVATFRNALEQAVLTAPTRRSEDLADQISGTIIDREVFTSPADDLALYRPALERITVADCLAAFREAWSPAHRYVLVSGNATIPGDAIAAITAAYQGSRNVAVAPPAAIADAVFAYTNFGAPGRVTRRDPVADLDLTLVTFANGVRLNLKRTDFEANTIYLNARVGTGQLTEPANKPGLGAFAGMTFTLGGLGKHSSDDLRRILAGRTVGLSFGVDGDALEFGGATNKEDLLLELQLLAAHITDPGYRPEALRQAQKSIEQAYLSYDHTPAGPLTLEVPQLLANGDHRFGLPSRDVMLSRTLDEARDWLAPQLNRGALEIAIVGDIDIEATIAAVAQTLGALPAREARPALAELRRVSFPARPFEKEYAVDTEIPNGVVSLYWPTTDANEIHRTRRMNLLAAILTDRLRIKVREELGDAYSPGAGSSPSEIYPGYGYMLARVTVEPTKAPAVAGVIRDIAAALATGGVTEDELIRAKEPVLTSLRESSRTNAYWLSVVLAKAQEKPEVLDWCRSRYTDYQAITKAEVDALARQYLPAERSFRVTVLPVKK